MFRARGFFSKTNKMKVSITKSRFQTLLGLPDKDTGELIKALIRKEQGEIPQVKSKAVKAILSTWEKPAKKEKQQEELIPIVDELKAECEGFLRWIAKVMHYSIELRDITTNANKQKNYCNLYRKLRNQYSKDEIKAAVNYAVNNDFWRPNFLSPMKLEKTNKDGITYMNYFLSQSQLKRYEAEKNILNGDSR